MALQALGRTAAWAGLASRSLARPFHTSRIVVAGAHVIEASDSDFGDKVIKADTPVIVDFYAEWCGPCRMLTPVLEKAVNGMDGAVKLVKVNVDENPEVSRQHKVSSIPLVIAYSKGKVVDQFMGARDGRFVEEFLGRLTAQK